MLISEFLDRQSRRYARAKKRQLRPRLDAFMNKLALAMFFLCLGIIIGQVADRIDHPFNYTACDTIVAKGNLPTAPIPADYEWKELLSTPGGNWCVILESNDSTA